MTNTKVHTEFNDYDITAYGLIISGEVHNMLYDLNCERSEYPEGQELEDLEDFIKESLLDSVYSPELDFTE